MPRLPSLPCVEIYANESGGITIFTRDPTTQMDCAVDLPLEFIPGIIVLLREEFVKINRENHNAGSADDTTESKKDK